MPTTVTKTVKTSGGDYSSLASWVSGRVAANADFTSADVIEKASCYNFSDNVGTLTNINGATTDATRYWWVYATERHNGKWSTSGYRLESNHNFSRVLYVSDFYCRIDGIQVRQNGTGSNAYGPISVDPGSGTSDIRIENSIIAGGGGTTTDNDGSGIQFVTSSSLTLRNSMVFNSKRAGIRDNNFGGGTFTVQNVTFAANGTYGIHANGATYVVKNCYSGGNGTDAYSGSMTLTTCMHDTATSFTGSTGSKTYNTTQFTNVTATTEDFHLPSGSALIDAGTDLSVTFTTDIDGDTRSGTWDIGADEYVSAATAHAPYYFLQFVGRQAI